MKGNEYDQVVLRLGLGITFVTTGLTKLAAPAGTAMFLGSLGFPMPLFWAWLLLLSEIIFGAAILFGYMIKYSVWPLVTVLTVATLMIYVPAFLRDVQGSEISILLHFIGIMALISLFLREVELESVPRK